MDAVWRCGGDLNRVIDSPTRKLDDFARYVSRMKALALGIAPLVVLTRTNPLALAVTGARRTLENFVPALRNAAWLVFYERREDPFFEAEADSIGILEPRSEYSAVWTSPTGQYFLIVARGDHFDLDSQVHELLTLTPGRYELDG